MPVDASAPVQITALSWVPDFARGQVRDLRVRWALEEAGIPYSVRKYHGAMPRPVDYLQEQPFDQVPSYSDGEVRMFESGAIVLHIGEKSEALLPADAQGRARAVTWLFAALNSVEPHVWQLALIDLFYAGEEWAKLRRPSLTEFVNKRLSRLADHLGDRDFLEDRFTAGDLLMTSVLRILDNSNVLDAHPTLAAYKARCEGRPAFGRALNAQLADFDAEPPTAATGS